MRGVLTFYSKTLSLLANNQVMRDLAAVLAVPKFPKRLSLWRCRKR